MDLVAIAPIIEKLVKDALRERRYTFGFQGRTGVSNKIASSTLVNSVKVNVRDINNINTLEIDIAAYGNFVDEGRLPGKKGIPVSAIMQWLGEKGIGVRDERGRFVKGNKEMSKSLKGNKILPIAFAIQKSIQRFGIRSSGFIEVALGKIEQDKKIMSLLEEQTMEDLIKIIQQQ